MSGHQERKAPDRLLGDPAFRRLLLAAAVSKAGTQISFLGIPLVAVIALDASPAEVGVLGVMNTIAFLLIGLPAGPWLDRRPLRPVMVAADVSRAILLGSVPTAWMLGLLTMQQLWIVALLTGVATVFFDVAAQSYLPAIVGRNRLIEANGHLSSWDAATTVAGPSAGGWLVQLVTAPGAIVFDAVSYLWSALCLARIRRHEPAAARTAERRLLSEISEGVVFVFRHPLLRPIAISGALTNLSLQLCMTMMPVLFERDLSLSPGALGMFFAFGGFGIFLGASTARRLAARFGEGRTTCLLGVAAAPFSLVVPFVDRGAAFWLAALAWLTVTYRVGVNNVILVSFRQQVTPDRLLNRMNATMRFLMTGVLAMGAAIAGTVGQLAGARAAILVGALGLAVVWLPIFFSPLRRARELSAESSAEPLDPSEGVPAPNADERAGVLAAPTGGARP